MPGRAISRDETRNAREFLISSASGAILALTSLDRLPVGFGNPGQSGKIAPAATPPASSPIEPNGARLRTKSGARASASRVIGFVDYFKIPVPAGIPHKSTVPPCLLVGRGVGNDLVEAHVPGFGFDMLDFFQRT